MLTREKYEFELIHPNSYLKYCTNQIVVCHCVMCISYTAILTLQCNSYITTGPTIKQSHTTASLPHCPTAPLPHCLTVPLPHCPTAPLPHCPTAPLPRCPIHYCPTSIHHQCSPNTSSNHYSPLPTITPTPALSQQCSLTIVPHRL